MDSLSPAVLKAFRSAQCPSLQLSDCDCYPGSNRYRCNELSLHMTFAVNDWGKILGFHSYDREERSVYRFSKEVVSEIKAAFAQLGVPSVGLENLDYVAAGCSGGASATLHVRVMRRRAEDTSEGDLMLWPE